MSEGFGSSDPWMKFNLACAGAGLFERILMQSENKGHVHVVWRGLLGNRLFQVAGGLVLSIDGGAKLRSLPIPGFPFVTFTHPDPPPGSLESHNRSKEFRKSELLEAIDSGRHVVVNGHHEQYRNYRDHKIAIRTLLTFHHESSYAPASDDLVVHLRLTGQNADQPYDLRALAEYIERKRSGKVIIVTDYLSHPFIHENFRKPNTVVVNSDTLRDFSTLIRANRLILTPSTFGWWAAFLGHAEEVHFPDRQGIWARPYIDLFVDDESRYIKY